jgi:hypothetical protein
MKLRALGIIFLVMAMVLSIAAVAGATPETLEGDDATPTTIPAGSEDFTLTDPGTDPLVNLVDFVLYWGFEPGDLVDGCPPVDTPETGEPATTDTTVPSVCLDVTGQNGQVNHGTFVSAFAHWLHSSDGQTVLEGYEGPRGQLMKQMAKSDFGKGPKDKTTDDEVETEETDDGHANGWSNPNNPHSHS